MNNADTIQRAVELLKIDILFELMHMDDGLGKEFFRTLVAEGCPAEAIIRTFEKMKNYKEKHEE